MNREEKMEMARQKLDNFRKSKDLSPTTEKHPSTKDSTTRNIEPSVISTNELDQIKELKQRIIELESDNCKLTKLLQQEQKLVILLQAEVEAMPDLVEKFHFERNKLLKRLNTNTVISDKSTKPITTQVTDQALERDVIIKCAGCKGEYYRL